MGNWRKAPGKQNPRAAKSFDKWIVVFMHPRLADYEWTGSGLKPGYKMRRLEKFKSQADAERAIQTTVLDHIVNYKTDFGQFITGWTNPAAKNASADSAVAQQLLAHLLACLRAAQQSHWTSHWQVQGTSFYADHQMFERFYGNLTVEIDALAEKMVAMFGEGAVALPPQMRWQAFLAAEWDEFDDIYYRAYHIEKFLQEHFLKTYEALKHLKQLTLGLDDYLMATSNEHETNQYLLGQRIGGRLMTAAGRLKYRVSLFSDKPGARALWTKTFTAVDDARADIEALRLVKPELKKHDDAEDWVVEPIGHKGKKAARRPNGLPAVVTKTKGSRKPMAFVIPEDPASAPPDIARGDWFRAPTARPGDKGILMPPSGKLNQWLFAPDRLNEHWDKVARNQKIIEAPHNFHPVKVEPPKAKRKEYPFEGYIDFQGLKIDVENKAGSTRSGTGPEGDWSTYMHSHYGEIRGTEGTDGDKLDVYVGENHDSPVVVVIHQHNPWDGKFDEDKVMVGYDSVEEAIGAYKKQYDRPGFYLDGKHTAMNIGKFWRWCHDKNNKGKKVSRRLAAAAEPVEYDAEARKGWFFLHSGGDIGALTHALDQEMVRRVPPPQQVAKARGAHKAFSFHWSNAQAKWDVIMVREFPWGIDGAEFIVFTGKKALSPVGKTWSLAEMRYVAKGLNKHPGYAQSPESARRAKHMPDVNDPGRKWEHIGGDLEASYDGAVYIDIRPKGGGDHMFVSKAALVEAMSLFPTAGKAALHKASLWRAAAQVGTDSAAIYALAPEQLQRLIEGGSWLEEWATSPGSPASDKLVRQHGGAVFHTGGDGIYDVKIPTPEGAMPIVKEMGYMAPYGTPEFGKVAAAGVPGDWHLKFNDGKNNGWKSQIGLLISLLGKMDVPKKRQEIRLVPNLRWVSRNLQIENKDHKDFKRAQGLVRDLMKQVGRAERAKQARKLAAAWLGKMAAPKSIPPIPSNIVPKGVDGWQLYDTAGASTAARKMTTRMENNLKSVGRNIRPEYSDAKNATALAKIVKKMYGVLERRTDWGATDTEPRNEMYFAFENYLKTYLDRWDFPKTFAVLGG